MADLKKLKNKVLSSRFIKDNFILLIGTLIVNILGFLYHFYIGRALGPESYGILGAILSLLYVIAIVFNTIQTSLTKFFSNLNATNQHKKINYLLIKSNKKLFIYGILITLVFLAFSPLIASFLKISIKPIIVLSLLIPFSLTLPVVRAILQGLQKFKGLSINLVLEGISKFSLGVLFVAIGWQVSGAILAIVLSFIIPYIFGLFQVKSFFRKEKEKVNSSEIYKGTFPVFITLLLITSMYSIDTLLVKHFFSDLEAGFYSSVSLIGKILFFGSLSISQVMFPKLVELKSKNQVSKKLFYRSLALISSVLIFALIIYFLFPELIIKILFGGLFLPASNLIAPFGLFMALISLIYLISLYHLSSNKHGFIYILLFALVLESALIYFIHVSLLQIVLMISIITFIVFIILLLLVIFEKNEKTKNETLNNNTSLQ